MGLQKCRPPFRPAIAIAVNQPVGVRRQLAVCADPWIINTTDDCTGAFPVLLVSAWARWSCCLQAPSLARRRTDNASHTEPASTGSEVEDETRKTGQRHNKKQAHPVELFLQRPTSKQGTPLDGQASPAHPSCKRLQALGSSPQHHIIGTRAAQQGKQRGSPPSLAGHF